MKYHATPNPLVRTTPLGLRQGDPWALLFSIHHRSYASGLSSPLKGRAGEVQNAVVHCGQSCLTNPVTGAVGGSRLWQGQLLNRPWLAVVERNGTWNFLKRSGAWKKTDTARHNSLGIPSVGTSDATFSTARRKSKGCAQNGCTATIRLFIRISRVSTVACWRLRLNKGN